MCQCCSAQKWVCSAVGADLLFVLADLSAARCLHCITQCISCTLESHIFYLYVHVMPTVQHRSYPLHSNVACVQLLCDHSNCLFAEICQSK